MGLTLSRNHEIGTPGLRANNIGMHLHQSPHPPTSSLLVTSTSAGGAKGGSPCLPCEHVRKGSVRGPPRQPMPDIIEIERRFTKVLVGEFIAHFINELHGKSES